MKLGAVLLNEKTPVSLSIINLLILVSFAITASFTLASWKTEIENKIEINTAHISDEKIAREQADIRITEDVEENSVIMLEIQSSQSDIQTSIARVETNVLWIIKALQSGDN